MPRGIRMKPLNTVYQLVVLVIGIVICPWAAVSAELFDVLKEKEALMFEQGFK